MRAHQTLFKLTNKIGRKRIGVALLEYNLEVDLILDTSALVLLFWKNTSRLDKGALVLPFCLQFMEDSFKATATMVPHLGKDAYPRGNSYNGDYITQHDAAKLSGKGRLKKIEGLLYDINIDRFDPFDSSIWPYRVERTMNEARMELMAETFDEGDVNASHTLTIHRTPRKRSKHILKTCVNIANSHNRVRGTGWGGVGGMYSA